VIFVIVSLAISPLLTTSATTIAYFHADSVSGLPLFGVSGSELVYRADTQAPTAPHAVKQALTASIPASRLALLGFEPPSQSAYLGYAAWLLEMPHDANVDGTVTINVWMSSSDSPGFLGGTGYFFALADVNPSNLADNFQRLWSNFQVSIGNILTNNPTKLSTSVFSQPFMIMDHRFNPGRALAMIVGAASTKIGWQFNVFFDGQDNPSSATLPISAIAVPEFRHSDELLVLCFVIVVFACLERSIRSVIRKK
jgi:hypothetical protein